MTTAQHDVDPTRQMTRQMHDLGRGIMTVSRVEVIGPEMVRVALAGERAQTLPFPAWAAGDHVKFVVPNAAGELELPAPGEGAGPGPGGRPEGRGEGPKPSLRDLIKGEVRDYTVRGVDREAGEVIVDGAVHEHGPVGRWFANARVGQRVGLLGPRGSKVFPSGYAHYILVADETALPSLGRWLEQEGLSARVTVITVSAVTEPYPFPEPAAAEVEPHHLVLPLGSEVRGPALAEHLRVALRTSPAPDDVFVWASGEANALRSVRALLKELDFPRHARHIEGYWREGVVAMDHHQQDPDD
ncbi:MAG: siderophore-interacting protein [Arthrobacter sp.]|jgi:NADPH-dependent ferric siderophore reductase|nr:siderophore-interacting protein [Arthrobacter sp.]